MSRRANCYDNATMESFWSTLKWSDCSDQPARHAAARQANLQFIEGFYNPRRFTPPRLQESLDFESVRN